MSENKPTNDAHILKERNIKARDLSSLNHRIEDKAMKCTWYFSSPEQKQRCIEKMEAVPLTGLKRGGKKKQGV